MTTAMANQTEKSPPPYPPLESEDAKKAAHGLQSLRFLGRLLGFLGVRFWPIIALLILWPVWLVVNGFSRTVAPMPQAVGLDLGQNFTGVYLEPVLWTIFFTAVGLTGGMLLGVILGVLVWMSPIASGMIMPSALVIRVVPMTALVPILARLMGYGDFTVFLIVILVVFFPAFSLTISGMAATPTAGTDLFGVLGAPLLHRIFRLHLPHAIPSIMLAFRISAPLSVAGVLLADYLLAGRGLGNLIRHSSTFLDVEREWGAALVATALSVACFGMARKLERVVNERVT